MPAAIELEAPLRAESFSSRYLSRLVEFKRLSKLTGAAIDPQTHRLTFAGDKFPLRFDGASLTATVARFQAHTINFKFTLLSTAN